MWRAMSLLARWQWILARSDLIRREIAPQSAAGKRLLDFFFHPVVRDAPPGECQTHRRTVVSGGGAQEGGRHFGDQILFAVVRRPG
jgi:hypothetical protein